MTRIAILTIALTSFGLAQLRVPIAGYVVDPATTQMRPILGALGAALIGDSVALPQNASAVAISPDQKFAIVAGDTLTVATLGPDGFGAAIAVESAMSSPDRIEFSAGSSAAALYSAKLNRIQIVTGLPAAPQVVREIPLDDDVFALAISGDAGIVLTANSKGNVALLAPDGSTRPIASGDSIVAIQFLPDASRAIAIDRSRNQLLLLSGLPDTPAVQVLLDRSSGVDSPGAVQVTTEGRRALIANSGAGNLLSVNLDTGDAMPIACAFTPRFLHPLLQGAYIVTDDDHKRVWLLEPGTSRILFVPALVP